MQIAKLPHLTVLCFSFPEWSFSLDERILSYDKRSTSFSLVFPRIPICCPNSPRGYLILISLHCQSIVSFSSIGYPLHLLLLFILLWHSLRSTRITLCVTRKISSFIFVVQVSPPYVITGNMCVSKRYDR